MGCLIHGRHARIFGQIFDHGFWQGFLGQEIQFDSSTGTEKYSFTGLLGRKNTAFQFYRDGKKREQNHVLKSHINTNPTY